MKEYKNGFVTLYNSDCMEAFEAMKENEFDLAIVDPPYGIGESGEKNASRGKPVGFSSKSKAKTQAKNYKSFAGGDKEPPPPEYFGKLFRVSKNQIIFGGNHMVDRIGKSSPAWIVWDKKNGASDFADCELAWTSFKSAVRKFEFRWNGMLQEDMKNKEIRIHPTQKPVALYKWILTNYAKPGDRILDKHAGSCSLAIACHDLGFRFTGYELDEHYFDLAVKRLETHQAQAKLFEVEA